ncbi:unnamed protein product [Nezara viridula]|uniref:palmitoyl-protein hydrolase n=1 Tax=Nezara viridula TaxID=85310 RepID=A0A9P0HCP4_NEZVI|nr:unnamed protein product [Nezara viridula]
MVAVLEEINQLNNEPSACLIFLHGVGRSGQYEKNKFIKLLGENASFKHIKIVFPTSPVKHFSLFGKDTNCWFNAEEENGRMKTSLSEIDEAADSLREIIIEQEKCGIKRDRIVIGGESQGGMISLHAAYRFYPEIAGVVAVSACLPEQHTVYKAAKDLEKRPPLLMIHSSKDGMIPFEWGKIAFDRLEAVGVEGKFHEIAEASHELILQELEIIYKWMEAILPQI